MAFDEATTKQLEKEFLPFLSLDARIDLKSVAIRYVLEMTGSEEGRKFVLDSEKFLPAVLSLTNDKEKDIMKDSLLAVINFSAEGSAARKIMSISPSFIVDLLSKALKTDFVYADEASSIISNITRLPEYAEKIAEQILEPGSQVSMERIVTALCTIDYNKNAKLHYLGTILSNLTQVSKIRRAILDKEMCIIQKLLPFTEYKDSKLRRGGVIGTLKNCCFEYDQHRWLLSEDVDIISRLLLPLAGGEELDDDDMEKLPVDLQYLPPDKEREADPDIRTMLLEAITLLCSTSHGRLQVKSINAYVILREHHKWERDPGARVSCQKLCEQLISDEPEKGMEELHEVEVPPELEDKFNKMDMDLLADFQSDQQTKEEEAETEKDG